MVTLTPKILELEIEFLATDIGIEPQTAHIWSDRKEMKNNPEGSQEVGPNMKLLLLRLGEQFIFSHLIFIYSNRKHYYPTSVQIMQRKWQQGETGVEKNVNVEQLLLLVSLQCMYMRIRSG